MIRLIIALVVVSGTLTASAQQMPVPVIGAPDHLIGTQGQSRFTVITGIPFVAVGEYSYAFSGGFTMGLLAGTTPTDQAYGVRPRGVIYESDAEMFRVLAKAAVLYYPGFEGNSEAWWLAYPEVTAEWKLASGVQLSLEAGLVGTTSAEEIDRMITGNGEPQFDKWDRPMDPDGFNALVWQTVGVGSAVPLTSFLTLYTGMDLVMDGFAVADERWIGGPPVIVTMAITVGL
jgi:hypothetical protein